MSRSSTAARTYLAFVLLWIAAMLVAAIASPWVHMLIAPLVHKPLPRLFDRLMMPGLIVGSAWLIRNQSQRLQLLGFNPGLSHFLRRVLLGLLFGALLMLVALVPLLLWKVRVLNERVPTEMAGWMLLAAKGLASGIAVALLEETFFRGAMQGSLQRIGAARWAMFGVPLLYSAVHFLGHMGPMSFDPVNAWSGFDVWRNDFHLFGEPLRILDAFVALYMVGLLLALVRQRWGDISGCIGLHAGFVAVIAVFHHISVPASDARWSFLIGTFDGLLGWWVAALAATTCAGLWYAGRIRTA